MNGWRGLGLGIGGFIASVFPRAAQVGGECLPHCVTLSFEKLSHDIACGVFFVFFSADVAQFCLPVLRVEFLEGLVFAFHGASF